MRCLDCANLTSHSKTMARDGFGNCRSRKEWEYLSITHERACDLFAQAAPEAVKVRGEWAAKVGV